MHSKYISDLNDYPEVFQGLTQYRLPLNRWPLSVPRPHARKKSLHAVVYACLSTVHTTMRKEP